LSLPTAGPTTLAITKRNAEGTDSVPRWPALRLPDHVTVEPPRPGDARVPSVSGPAYTGHVPAMASAQPAAGSTMACAGRWSWPGPDPPGARRPGRRPPGRSASRPP